MYGLPRYLLVFPPVCTTPATAHKVIGGGDGDQPCPAGERGISRFRACISPHNTPSLTLIRKLGFVQIGAQHHERRGEELIFHHDSEAERPARRP
jgi:hypothetical protein